MKIDNSKIFIDTNIFIYFIDKVPKLYESIKEKFENYYDAGAEFCTSTISKSEFYVKPMQMNDRNKIILFNNFIKDLNMEVVDIKSSIAVEAAYLRSKYKSLKLADALQLAAYTVSGCNMFFTNDEGLDIVAGVQFLKP